MRSIRLLVCLAALMVAASSTFAATPGPPMGDDASLSGTDLDADRTMQGGVGPRSDALIAKWLRANPHRALTLHLNSKGGLAAHGARLYDAIQAHGLMTTDVGSGQLCLSACVFLWLGGQVRTVAGQAALGFHSAYCPGRCDERGIGLVNQTLLDILARTEPALAVLLSNTGAMISGRSLIALASRENGHWSIRTFQPPS